MSKHTQGKWEVKVTPRDPDFFCEIWCDEMGSTIAAIYRHVDEVEANAQLIAAAPELLDALKQIISQLHDTLGTCELYKIAQDAIAKAEGKEVKSHD